MLLALSIFQLVYVLLLSPLIFGIFAKLEERIESKQGPSVFQPYYDIYKLFQKESIVPSVVSPLFKSVPYISFSFYMLLTLVLPIVTAFPLSFGPTVDFIGGGLTFGAVATIKKLSSLDSRNNYSHLGTSRASSIGALSEPITVLIFITLGVLSKTNNPYVINNVLQHSRVWYFSLAHWFVSVSFFMVLIIELGKLPIESHSTAELGMIDQAMDMEYSGPELAFLKWGSYIKKFLLMSVFLNVYVVPFWVPLSLSISYIFVYSVIHFLKLIVLVVILVLIEETVSKLRLFKIFDYVSMSFSFAFLAILVFFTTRGGF